MFENLRNREFTSVLGINPTKFSNSWHRHFLKRYPEISLRISSSTDAIRSWTKSSCENWIQTVQELAEDGFLDDPDRILNLDESAFKLGEDFSRVYTLKGERRVIAAKKGATGPR